MSSANIQDRLKDLEGLSVNREGDVVVGGERVATLIKGKADKLKGYKLNQEGRFMKGDTLVGIVKLMRTGAVTSVSPERLPTFWLHWSLTSRSRHPPMSRLRMSSTPWTGRL